MPNGRPMESETISRSFKRLIRNNDLPDVVFHSLRHTNTTYKLKLNNGDMKAVQGDTGHAQLKMISDVCSHILDEDRKKNAVLFENEFYQRCKKDEPQKPSENVSRGANQVMKLLEKSPQLASELLNILNRSAQKSCLLD